MAEEKKKNPEGAKSKAETPKEETPAQATEKKNMKINRMTLAEIEAKIEELRVAQGGLASKYARQLLRRKNTLGSS
jgi:hypothetical protein